MSRTIKIVRRFIAETIKGIRRFIAEEDGPTAVEYGVLLALVAGVVIVGAGLLGANVNALWASNVAIILAILS